jgi:hypothetical protein
LCALHSPTNTAENVPESWRGNSFHLDFKILVTPVEVVCRPVGLLVLRDPDEPLIHRSSPLVRETHHILYGSVNKGGARGEG